MEPVFYGPRSHSVAAVTPGKAVCVRYGHQAGGVGYILCARTSTGDVLEMLWYFYESTGTACLVPV